MSPPKDDPLMNELISALRKCVANKSKPEAMELFLDQIRRSVERLNADGELNVLQTSALMIAVANIAMMRETVREMRDEHQPGRIQ